MENLKIIERTISSSIEMKGKVVVVEKIKYPYFECDDEKDKVLFEKMNSFYNSVAEKYSNYARRGMAKKIAKNMGKCTLPVCMGMKYAVSSACDDITSVVLDLSFSEGDKIRMRRFSQMWYGREKRIISIGQLLDLSMENKKILLDMVLSKVSEEASKGRKGYFEDVVSGAKKHFCFGNSFLAPDGIVFFFESGILKPEKYGAVCFVIPYDNIRHMLKPDFSHSFDNKKQEL